MLEDDITCVFVLHYIYYMYETYCPLSVAEVLASFINATLPCCLISPDSGHFLILFLFCPKSQIYCQHNNVDLKFTFEFEKKFRLVKLVYFVCYADIQTT